MYQLTKLLAWLRTHDGITQLEAFNGIGCCRLSERIRELEEKGHVISHTTEKVSNRARVTRYRLLESHDEKPYQRSVQADEAITDGDSSRA